MTARRARPAKLRSKDAAQNMRAEPVAGLDARNAALQGLTRVFVQGRPLDPVLGSDRWIQLAPRDRAFARLMAMTVLRRAFALDAALDGFLKSPQEIPPKVRTILRLAAAQLLYLGTGAHAAVNAAVEQAGADAVCRRHKGLVNAVARRVAEKAQTLRAEVDQIPNTPGWLRERWERTYGADALRSIEAAHLEEPPLHLTVRNNPEEWAARLGGSVLPTGTVALAAGEVTSLPGYDDGEWWVQDVAASLPVRLLGDVAGKDVFDLCAAPGGKTAQLAAAGARVTSLDLWPERLARLRENLDRLHLDARLVTADLLAWQPEAPAKLALLDAPCSSTGTIRRHPDVAHVKSPADITALSRVQADMLAQASGFLAPGGVLVYCTCSLEPEEGPALVNALLAERPGLRRIPVRPEEIGGLAEAITPDGDLRTLPCHLGGRGGMDGFYAARLSRG